MSTGVIEKLQNMPECFTDKLFMRLNNLSPETTRVTLSRMKNKNLIESAGIRSGVYFNLLKNNNASSENMIKALLFIYPTAVLIGESVLHNAGWITQIPSKISVAVLKRRSIQQINGFSIEGKGLEWFKFMNNKLITTEKADFSTYGLKAVPPEYALTMLFKSGESGLDYDDIEIPDDKIEQVSMLFAENDLNFGAAHKSHGFKMR